MTGIEHAEPRQVSSLHINTRLDSQYILSLVMISKTQSHN